MKKSKQLNDIEVEHLSALTSIGIHEVGIIVAAAEMLQQDFLGEITMTKEEKGKIIKIILESAKKYHDFVNQCLRERKQITKMLLDSED